MSYPILTPSDFPPVAAGCVAAWRAVLASGELTDAYAESFGLLAAHGQDIRRAYRCDGATVRTLPWRTLCHIAELEESAARSGQALRALAESAMKASAGADGKALADSPIGHARYIGESLACLADSASTRNGRDLAAHVAAIACHSAALAHIAASGQASHATIAASLARADSKLADIADAAAMPESIKSALAGSRYMEACDVRANLAGFARSGDAKHLAGAILAIGRLESAASARDAEARDAEARAESLAAVNSTNARERAALADRLAACERESNDWRERAEHLESEAADYRARIANLESAGDLAAGEHSGNLADRLAKLSRDLAGADAATRDAVERGHKLAAENATYRQQRDSEGARAASAERQLAEYRTLCAALPLGMAGAYPAALPLLRCYLADRESGK